MKKYNSNYYKSPIKVENIWWEIIVSITTNDNKEVIYSWYDKINKCSYSPYINKSLLWIFLHSIPKKVLVLWVWAGWSIKFLQDHIKNIEITWVEIDEAMVLISKEIMEIPQENIIIKDAFLALDDFKKNYFDSILIDCYWVDSKIPEKLMSFEFFEKCKKVLTKNWIITVNMANFELERNNYETMHQNLKQNFWEFFSLFLSWKNDISNVVWVYNLDKNYKASDFTKNFLKHVKNNEILNDFEILKNTFVDEKKIYLK